MKNATVYNEAAPSEGSERFYRGAKAGEATPSKGLVFSRDRADAAAYAAKIGGELSYVDVPKGRVAELKPAANKPEARVIVSAEMAQGRRVAEPAQMTQAAPRQRGAGVARDRAAGGISGNGRASPVPSVSITAASGTSNPPRKEWCSRGTPPTPGDMRSRPEVSSPTSMWRRSACRKFSRRRRRRRHGWS